MQILDRIISLVAPYACLGCQIEGNLICLSCREQLTPLPYPKLGYRYSGPAKDLVGQLKFSGAQAAAGIMAELLAKQLAQHPIDPAIVVVPVPTASRRARSRGYDQAALIARQLARKTALHYYNCLLRHGQTRQVGASRIDRQRQLQGAYSVRRPVAGHTILLVDDVSTTGATLEAAATVLYAAGAVRVTTVAFAHA